MYFPFCNSKRRALKKGKHVDRQDPQQQHEQARVALNFTPIHQGQVETERLLSGDASAVGDLKALFARAETLSRQAPQLNLSLRATDKFLQESPEAVEDLIEEQRLAQARIKKAAGRQWNGHSLMGNTSLIGESFERSCRGLCGGSSSSSTEVKDEGKCRGHLQFYYCSDGEGCHAQCSRPSITQSVLDTAEVSERQTDQPIPSEEDKEDGEDDGDDGDDEGDEEFSFDDHLTDEDNYRQSLHEVTALAVTPARARSILIPSRTPSRTPSLSRKRGHNSLRESSSVVPSEATPLEYWSTRGSAGSLLESLEGDLPNGDNVPEGLGHRRSFRLFMTAGPLSGPPTFVASPLPVKDTVRSASSVSIRVCMYQ